MAFIKQKLLNGIMENQNQFQVKQHQAQPPIEQVGGKDGAVSLDGPEAGQGKWAAEGKGTAASTSVGVNKCQNFGAPMK